MTQILEESVARGVALLDAHRPGWREEIQRVRLDMAKGYHCILGQLYGDYAHGLDSLWPMTEEPERLQTLSPLHGFIIPEEEADGDDELWDKLQALWLKALGTGAGSLEQS